MQINIYNEKTKQRYPLEVDSKSTLKEIYQMLSAQNKDFQSLQTMFLLETNILKWDLTIQDLKVFYSFNEDQDIVWRSLDLEKEPSKSSKNSFSQEIEFIKRASIVKNRDWHLGYLDESYRSQNKPQLESIFVNRYQIIMPIQESCLINIYKALDLNEQKIVYLFVGSKHIVDYSPPENFVHHLFLKTHDVGEFENNIYSSVSYLEGKYLSEIIGEHTFTLETILSILVELAKTIYAMHCKNHIHGNLNTENILLTPKNIPYILNHHLIYKQKKSVVKQKCPKNIKTIDYPIYSSPEVLYLKKPSMHSDIFSFGAICYHLVTKHAPFGFHEDTLIHEELIPIHVLNQNIPEDLCRLISSMLEEDIEKRPQDMKNILSTFLHINNNFQTRNLPSLLKQKSTNSDSNFWVHIVNLLDYGNEGRGKQVFSSIQPYINPQNIFHQKNIVFLKYFYLGNQEKMIFALSQVPNKNLREIWTLQILENIPIPIQLLLQIPHSKLLPFLFNENEQIKKAVIETLMNVSAQECFFDILDFLEENSSLLPYLMPWLQKYKDLIIAPLFMFLFSDKRRRIKLAQDIFKELKLELLIESVVKFKKGDEKFWQKAIGSLEQNNKIYFTILYAFTTLLRDKNKNVRWLAGNALFICGTRKSLQHYLLFLKQQKMMNELLQIINFAGSNVAYCAVNILQDVMEKEFLQYMWHLRWNSKDENRIKTCQILTKNKTAHSTPFLIETLFSSNTPLRKEAEACICKMDISVIEKIMPFIAESEIQKSIQNILVSFGIKVLPLLISYLEKTSNIVEKKYIIKTLGKIGSEEAICAMLPYLSSQYSSVYELAKQEIIAQGKKCEEWLIGALKSNTREHIQEIMVAIGSNKVIKSLLEDLTSENLVLSKKIVKWLDQIDISILKDELQNAHSSILYKIFFLTANSQIHKTIEEQLWNDKTLEELKLLITKDEYTIKSFQNEQIIPCLICGASDTSLPISTTCAKILATQFAKQSGYSLSKIWENLWNKHLVALLFTRELDIYELKIIEPSEKIKVYGSCIVSLQDEAISNLLNILEKSSTILGIEIILILGKIQTKNAINELANIQKNTKLQQIWRQVAHIVLCHINKDFELIIQFLHQQKGTFVSSIAQKMIVCFLEENNQKSQELIAALFRFKSQNILEDLLTSMFFYIENIQNILYVFQNMPKEQYEQIIPILLKNLQNKNKKILLKSITILSLFPNKQILNALQVLLMRKSEQDDETKFIEQTVTRMRTMIPPVKED